MTKRIERHRKKAVVFPVRPMGSAALAVVMAAAWGCGGGGAPLAPDAAGAGEAEGPPTQQLLAVSSPPSERIDATLLLALSSADSLTRMNAVADAVDADPSGALVQDAFLDDAVSVRLEAVDEGARLPREQAAELLQQALQDSDALVREAALYTLAEVDAEAARQAAERAAIDPDVMVREAAEDVLGGLEPLR